MGARFQASENAGREREADAEADTEADRAVRRPVAAARRRGRDAQPGVGGGALTVVSAELRTL